MVEQLGSHESLELKSFHSLQNTFEIYWDTGSSSLLVWLARQRVRVRGLTESQLTEVRTLTFLFDLF